MTTGVDPIVFYLIIFVLAIFVGYHVVWSVTPALHTPLMSVTNAISAIILVGAMLAAGPAVFDWGGWVGVAAVIMASVNAFGGFLVTQRMLVMFKRVQPAAASSNGQQAGALHRHVHRRDHVLGLGDRFRQAVGKNPQRAGRIPGSALGQPRARHRDDRLRHLVFHVARRIEVAAVHRD